MRKIAVFITTCFFLSSLLFAQNTGIIPTPQSVSYQSGTFIWDDNIVLDFDSEIQDKTLILQEYETLRGTKAVTSEMTKKSDKRRVIRFMLVQHLPIAHHADQGYTIEITEKEIVIKAVNSTGILYGWHSLKQIHRFKMRQYYAKEFPLEIPCMSIVDYPLLEYRGWMDDISRGPIPTLDFLKKQVIILSEFKLNFFTLYTENTFQTTSYPDMAPQDALTPEEIKELEQFAKRYHVQLIGNQQCFAHMEKILQNPFYHELADSPYNLNPGNPEIYSFLNQILKEEAACYSSPWFNINCDETEALGTGKGADYIAQVGVEEAYSRHIDSLHGILSSYGKRMMMWGDIALKYNTIRERLPNDIIMLVWSYVPADHFTEMIIPFKKAGFDFMVASGVSMWSTVFPSMESYLKNIANFARDGYNNGAMGLLNTAWDDSGESLFNSAWHALIWGAEMSWKPIVNEDNMAAEQERQTRIESFNHNFNYQFFHYYNDDVLITDYLALLSQFEKAPFGELYQFGSLWNTHPTQFFPSEIDATAEANTENASFATVGVLEQLRLILEDESNYEHPEILYCAKYAVNRIYINLLINKLKFNLYEYYKLPNEDNNKLIQASIQDLLPVIHDLKNEYLQLWRKENRSYWFETNMKKYDQLATTLQNIKQQIFITTTLSKGNKVEVHLRTLFNDAPIYYTTDGSEPDKYSQPYERPFVIEESCVVKAKTVQPFGNELTIEKYILSHKGIGALRKLHTAYSNYRSSYSGGGDAALLDGIVGSSNYKDGKWQGYQGVPIDVEMDFYEKIKIDNITVHFLQNFYDWILAPEDVEIYTSQDGKSYQLLRKEHFDIEQISGTKIGSLGVKDLKCETQYLRIVVPNPGVLPAEHPGAGSDSFIFVDEIIIK
jgi:hexosaminidase